MATKHERLSASEVLAQLGLVKNKSSSGYASKLAMLHNFIKECGDFSASVVCDHLTLRQGGREMKADEMRKEMIEHLHSRYRHHDPEIVKLEKQQSKLWTEQCEQEKTMKKSKKKDKSEMEAAIQKLEIDREELRVKIEQMIEKEAERLNRQLFTIDQMRDELQFFEATKVHMTTGTGKYDFLLPKNTKLYSTMCNLLRLPLPNQVVEVEEKLLYEIICLDNLIDLIRKAASMRSCDDLRPAMTGICLDFNKKGLQVVATDAHRMYMSKRWDCEFFTHEFGVRQREQDPFQIIIDPHSLPKLFKSKVSREDPITIHIYEGQLSGSINGVPVKFIDARFPDYKVVVPKYTQKARFERKHFISCVKQAVIYSNKCTNQVNVHFNGEIDFHAQDVDFSFESDIRMRVLRNEFGDFTIGFNGKFAIECLNLFKADTIDMLQCGSSTKAAIFTDGNDEVLLMPLMLNQ